MFFNKLKIVKIFFRVFYVFFFIFSISTVATAATVDDMREIIGDKRITDESFIKEVKDIIYRYRQVETKKELVALLESMGDFGYEKELEKLITQRDTSLSKLEDSFCSNKSVEEVIEKLSDSISILSEVGALDKPNTYMLDGFGENDYEEAYAYALSVLESINDKYDIGLVGEGLVPPTKGMSRLYRAFGENIVVTDTVTSRNNKGIDLFIPIDNDNDFKAEILSQFNGVVKSIDKIGKNDYKVVISHGVALKTIYKNISYPVVKKGEKVLQYDLIGYCDKDTMHFEVVLNTVSINPLYLYGDLGEQLYDDWYISNPGMASKRTDFSNVSKYVADFVDKDKSYSYSPTSVVSDDGNNDSSPVQMEDGYEKPDVPIVEYIEDDNNDN